MHKIWKLIKREVMTKLLTRGFLIGTLLGPILISGFYFLPAYFATVGGDSPSVVRLVDGSGLIAPQVESLFGDTLDNGQRQFIITPLSEADYRANPDFPGEEIEAGKTDIALIIPENLLAGGQITYLAESISNGGLIRLIRSRIQQAVNLRRMEDAGLDPGQVASLTLPISMKTLRVTKGETEESSMSTAFPTAFIFLMLLYMTILLYGAQVLRGVVEEKTSRILEVLLSSTNSFQLMMGKLFGVGALGLIQYVAWIVLAWGGIFLLGNTTPEVLKNVHLSPEIFVYFVIFFLLGYFQFSALYAAVGAMCTSQDDAQALSGPVTILVVLPFIISISLGMNNPDADLAKTFSMLPFFAPMMMFLRIELSNPALWEIGLAIAINLVAIVAIVWLAARIYRVGVLIYGKRPTFREILKWIRYA
ncbi:MAG TPA: ABC transporter permease [Calditrichia bacterium]|nr:ABC transporter permease [Calditrichota bacterium]HQU73189.1 ABC transporter permease [Calditrichia bacterium]HQV30733.1 ABC transporter permease [Calditrichia bacterium]